MRSLFLIISLLFIPAIVYSEYYNEEEQKTKWGTLFYPYFAKEIHSNHMKSKSSKVDYFPNSKIITIDGNKVNMRGDPNALYITIYTNTADHSKRYQEVEIEKDMFINKAKKAIKINIASNLWGQYFQNSSSLNQNLTPEFIYQDKTKQNNLRVFFRQVIPGSIEAKERELLRRLGNPVTSQMIKNDRPYTSKSFADMFKQPHMLKTAIKIYKLYDLVAPVHFYNAAEMVNEKFGNDFTTEMNVVRLFAKF